MSKDSLYFKLFANCILVKGNKESIICDLQQESFLPISNLLYKILLTSEEKNLTVHELKRVFDNSYNEGIDAYFEKLEKIGMGHFTDTPEFFPKLHLHWDSPYAITNTILEFDSSNSYSLDSVLEQLNEIGCPAIEFRFLHRINLKKIEQLLKKYEPSRFRYFKIYIKFCKSDNWLKDVEDLIMKNARVGLIIIHSADNTMLEKLKTITINQDFLDRIIVTDQRLLLDSKEIKNIGSFVLNITSFSEALSFNLGLNRKLCIDRYGNIKNYLTHGDVFGNINTNSIKEILNQKNFKSKWLISNDQVEICKECQFRYICVGNSDLIRKDGKIHKSEKCSFDPFINSWK